MGAITLVDETKARGFQLVAVHVEDVAALESLRHTMRHLVLSGQTRIHMKKESAPRKRRIASAIVGSGVRATVYDAGRNYAHELDARSACLGALIRDLSEAHAELLVLEHDESLIHRELQQLIEITRRHGCAGRLRYEHRRAAPSRP